MKSLVLLAIAGTLSLSANASNDVHVGTSINGKLYVDIDSISTVGDYRTAFITNKYYEDQTLLSSEKFNVNIVYMKYDCSSNPKKSKNLTGLSMKDDKVVDYMNVDSVSKWSVVLPGSMDDASANFICSY